MNFTWDENYVDSIKKYLIENVKITEQSHTVRSSTTKLISRPEIKKVVFNNPATIILWNDGTKSVVKCQNGEPFDAEKGFALAYLKKLLGNDNTFNKEIKKWVKWDAPVEVKYNEPLTIAQLKKMHGQKVYVVSLDDWSDEDYREGYTGWKTVNTKVNKLYDDDGCYYHFSAMNEPYGYHAYLNEVNAND